jgi:hypothetical protein
MTDLSEDIDLPAAAEIRTLDNTPISYGIDFERAVEALATRYGEAFQAHRAAKAAGEPVEALREHLEAIQSIRKTLRVDHAETIAAILAGTLPPPMPR